MSSKNEGWIMRAYLHNLVLLGAFLVSGCVPQEPYAPAAVVDPGAYRLGTGDQIRLIVFDQPALSNLYWVDSAGNVSIPLIGAVKADNKTTHQLEAALSGRLREQGLVNDPKIAVEVSLYRPFSILGEVRSPGRFPYFPGMTIEAAIASAGGYTIHANQEMVRVSRREGNEVVTEYCPPTAIFMPGDIIYVPERWF
jgi:polysaccharide biosynthesis/export protein